MIFIERPNLFLLNPGTAMKKPIINEKKIDIKEMLTVKPRPLNKKSKFDLPCSIVGSKTYHPQNIRIRTRT